MGECYEYGYGCDEDEVKAFECYEKAALRENTGALYNLATCYECGIGMEEDIEIAIKYYEKERYWAIVFAHTTFQNYILMVLRIMKSWQDIGKINIMIYIMKKSKKKN